MNGAFSVIFDKDTLVAVFFNETLAGDFAKQHFNDMNRLFRLRVMGGNETLVDLQPKRD